MNIIQIHFDGDIAINHQVSIRTLGKTLSHLQNALDRAYLENKYGAIWKHARMRGNDYDESTFLVQEPKLGGYILEFLANSLVTKNIIDRVAAAIAPALAQSMRQGEELAQSFSQQTETKRMQIENSIVKPSTFQGLIDQPSNAVIRSYGDRSITKEIDQILSIIRSRYSGESSFELKTFGT